MQFRTVGLAVLLGGSASCALVISYGDYKEGASTSTGSSAGTGGGGGSTSTSSTSSGSAGGAGPICPDGGLPSIEICGNDVDEDCNGDVCKHTAQWSRRYSDLPVDGGGGGLDRQINAVAAGSTNHAFAGWYNGTLDLGSGFSHSNTTVPGGRQLFVAHIDAFGVTKALANPVPPLLPPLPGEANGVAISANGNAAVAAGFLDTGAVANNNDMFVVLNDLNPANNWTKQIGGTGPDRAVAVAFDTSGNVLVAGFLGAGSGSLPCTQSNVSFNAVSSQLLVASLDVKTGHCIWGKTFAASTIFPSAMVLDSLGHLIVVGGFAGAIAGTTLVGSSWVSPFVLALNPTNGVTLWGQAFPTSDMTSSALPTAVAAGNKGRLYLSGKFQGQVAFGATTLVSANAAEDEALLVALDGSNAGAGKVSWAHRFGGPNGFNRATGMVVVPQVDIDAIFMAGITAGKMSAVPDGDTGPLCPNGGLFLLKLHGESPVWGECFGTGGVDTTDVVRLATKGTRFVLAGARKSPIDFGNGALAGQGANDAFIAQFDSL